MTPKKAVVVLIGPMGVGKTTIGKKLAKALGLPFRDTDALVVQKHGSIPMLFETIGESGFRDLEEAVVAEAIQTEGVVATGGGAVLRQTTRDRLKSATVFYLSTDGRHMASRLANGNRPLLQNGIEDWRRIYDERKPIYETTADYVINTSNQSLASAIDEIKARLAD
ncbi:MAG: shikimate kinase [Actinomycetales bacterium]|nr:shikimate kinase [Actinomycetales bacterium]